LSTMGVPTDHSKRDECGESDNFVESSTLILIVEMPRRVCVDNELQELSPFSAQVCPKCTKKGSRTSSEAYLSDPPGAVLSIQVCYHMLLSVLISDKWKNWSTTE
jgi:hypothetical protein